MATGADQDAPLAIGATAVLTLPKFWAEDPALWFVQVENKFRLHRITSQIRQYELLIDALPPQAATEVRDILLSPLGDTPQRRLQQLLSAEELGDRRPSQFLRHLQHLPGDKAASIDAAILRELFLQRLPPPVHVGLAVAHRLPLLELAELADRIMEVNSPTIGATQRTSDLTSDITELRKAKEKLTAEVSELRRESSQRARPCRPTLWSRQLPSTLTLSPVFYKLEGYRCPPLDKWLWPLEWSLFGALWVVVCYADAWTLVNRRGRRKLALSSTERTSVSKHRQTNHTQY
ncbi:hypothetical protein HPB47_012271 [Ixodes persulcatus]|uniref:Uncharacterized protein n=1 Tax=Ixodes persulcatus TaxID=34615 RepID=A0AC60NU08_IXOPE|nr:hypothetical protein HPB47_012271 [Ixodes persulcatus]